MTPNDPPSKFFKKDGLEKRLPNHFKAFSNHSALPPSLADWIPSVAPAF